MKSKFKFTFSAGTVRDQYMNLELKIQDQFTLPIIVNNKFEVTVDVLLPAVIEFHIAGKGKHDTIVKNNQIIADTFIKLDQIDIDGFVISPWQVPEEFFNLTSEDSVISTDYWGKNGIAKLTIDKDDPALWLLECPKII